MARKRVARKRRGTVKKTAAKATRRPAKKRATKRPAAAADEGLLTLTEVSKRTGISMPTLQRYKKEYQKRLQTVGKGRTQRYKVESLDTFQEIKKENLKKRGRPRKSAAAKKVKSAPPAKAAPEGLISLSEIGRRTGISYPTLLRYVRLHGRKIPSHGKGRKRRFPVEAVPVFARLRKESRRGRRKGSPAKKAPVAASGLETRMRQLEKSHAGLEKQLKKLLKALSKPLI
jgi:predicted DNA-binding transcriptional regulator AlpA